MNTERKQERALAIDIFVAMHISIRDHDYDRDVTASVGPNSKNRTRKDEKRPEGIGD